MYSQVGQFSITGVAKWQDSVCNVTANIKVINPVTTTFEAPEYVDYGKEFEVSVGVYGDENVVEEEITLKYDRTVLQHVYTQCRG